MTTKNLTAIPPDESESDSFQTLMHRFLMATQRLKLADKAMARGEDYGLASCVVEEATEALVQIRSDFEHWDMDRRGHTPKAQEVQS